jgi:hypothetical protein
LPSYSNNLSRTLLASASRASLRFCSWVSSLAARVSVCFQCCGSGIRCRFAPWILDPGWSKIRIRIRDEQPGSYLRELRNNFFGLKYLSSLTPIRDGKNSDPGSGMGKIRIRDKHLGSATLRIYFLYFFLYLERIKIFWLSEKCPNFMSPICLLFEE